MKTIEEKCFDLLETSHLNWSVEKDPLQSCTKNLPTESFGLFRNSDDKWLGTVGKGYIPLQNAELAMVILSAAQDLDLKVTRGGELLGGRKVYLQAELPSEHIGKSEIKRWITGLNSHDGTTSVGFGSTNTTVVCQNTYYRAYGEIQKFRHTVTMKERIEIAKIEMRRTLGLDVQLMKSFKRMAELPIHDEVLERVIKKLFELDKDQDIKDLSTKKVNKVASFVESVDKSIDEQGSTVWALFNGITRFANHVVSPKEITKQLDYIMLSGGIQMMNKGFQILDEYSKEKLPKFDVQVRNN